MTLSGMLFDLDGTLIDSGKDLAFAYNALRKKHGLPPLAMETLKPAVAYGINPLICRDFQVTQNHPDFAKYRREFTVIYTENLTKHTVLFAGVADLLNHLNETGIPWGIVTNKPKRFAIPTVEFFPEFSKAACMIAGDTLSYAKPHPYPLQHACSILNTAPAKTGMVGDTEVDIQAAQAAGCPSFAVTYGYQLQSSIPSWNATAIIDHPLDMVSWLTKKELS